MSVSGKTTKSEVFFQCFSLKLKEKIKINDPDTYCIFNEILLFDKVAHYLISFLPCGKGGGDTNSLKYSMFFVNLVY